MLFGAGRAGDVYWFAKTTVWSETVGRLLVRWAGWRAMVATLVAAAGVDAALYLGVTAGRVVGMCQTPVLSWGMRGFQLVW
jgi:hypothetical protein